MTNTLRERRKQQLRDEIVHAAQQLMSEKGYAAMSMDEVAAQVGISKPTLYTHFETKDDLIVAAITQKLGYLLALLDSEAGERSPLERLTRLLRKILHHQSEDQTSTLRPWTPEIFQMICSRDDALDYFQRIDAATMALVEAGIVNGEIDAHLDPNTVVRMFYATLAAGHMTPPFLKPGHAAPTMSAETLVTIFERGVRAQPA